jgi:Spy/CpxP family protein refolding chaperone
MSKQLHRLILACAAAGVAAGAWAQGAPDGGQAPAVPGDGAPPPHAWHGQDCEGEYGAHRYGRGDDSHRWHHHHHRHPGMLFRDLNLTPEQHQRIRVIVMTARLDALKQAGTRKPGDMQALMNPGDPGYRAAVEAAKKRAADRIQRMSDVQQQIYSVLTPDQKTELGKRIAGWKTHMAQRERYPKDPPAPAVR